MRTGFSTTQRLIQSTVLLFLATVLTSCNVSGLRVSTDPLEDAILLGLDGTGDDTLMVKKSDPEISGMWFGPRLGRRDRRSADEMQDDLEVVEVLRETPWALVPVKGGKHHSGGFIPRLGRDSNQDEDPDIVDLRSPPFAPRLGRRLVPFRPRMGRDHQPHDVYSPRLGRSVNPSLPHEKKQPPLH